MDFSSFTPTTLIRKAREYARRLWVRVVLMGLMAFVALGLTQLLEREAAARAAGAGFWADRDYQVQPAWATRRLRRLEHTFQIVSGRVLKVAETKRFTYLNFGKDWRTDFTASIKSRTARHLAEAGLKLSELEGRNIRVRGWITYRNGPMIEITQFGQIEVIGRQKGPGK